MRKSTRMCLAKSSTARLTTEWTASPWWRPRSKPNRQERRMRASVGWTRWDNELSVKRFAEFHTALTRYNAQRLQPRLPEESTNDDLAREHAVARAEIEF